MFVLFDCKAESFRNNLSAGMCDAATSYTSCMAEPQTEPQAEQKPGAGIDRTSIQRMLTLTPAERIKMAVREANKFAELIEKMRIR